MLICINAALVRRFSHSGAFRSLLALFGIVPALVLMAFYGLEYSPEAHLYVWSYPFWFALVVTLQGYGLKNEQKQSVNRGS